MPPSTPRTLADQLRGWSPEQLAELLRARPDLATPAPQDSAQLAARAVGRASVLRCLDGLDALHLGVLTALSQPDPDLRCVRAERESLDVATGRLAALALVWGQPARPVTVVADLLRVPPGVVEPDLEQISSAARAILDHLGATGADGIHQRSGGPATELLEAGLLVRRDDRHVTVPWSVRLALHDGYTSTDPLDLVPALQVSHRDPALVDRTAAGAAHDFVRRTELLLDRWGTHPPAALRAGGLGVRDLKTSAALLHLAPVETALVIETAHQARLLGRGMSEDSDDAWLPTDAFDRWQGQPTAERWRVLAQAWLASDRLSSAVGSRVGDKPVNALAPDLERTWLPRLRREVLQTLADQDPGADQDHGAVFAPALDSLLERLRWQRPRRPAARLAEVQPLLREAALLGVTAMDALTVFGRALLGLLPDDAILDDLLPRPVDHVLLQADLTAVAPGPLEQELARKLALVADVESRGGATVYRFASSSVRRAFDAGWSAAEVHAFVAGVSRTPVPQALSYLVDDVSRRFGTLRVGHAEAFLRSDDEAALAELVHHADAATLRLRRIAPTVVVSDVPLGTLLPRIRELGLAPVVEASDGTVRIARPDVFRARTGRQSRAAAPADPARLDAVVAAVRAGDRAAAHRPTAGSATTPLDVIALLRQAGESGGRLVIGYVGNDGTIGDRVITPRRVEGGQLTAYDERSDSTRTFAIHRITTVTATSRNG